MIAPPTQVAMRTLRVGLDVREWVAGRRTGIARYLANLVEEWSGSDSEVEPLLYGNRATVPPASVDASRIRRVDERLTVWWDQVSLARRLARDGADVFLSPYWKAPLWAPCPVVVTVHDLLFLDPSVYPQRGRRRLYRVAFLPAARLVGRRARRIVTDSEHSRRDVIRLLRAAPEKVKVVPLGLPPAQRALAADEARARVERAFGVRAAYVLYVGNFKPHKNVGRLLEAFARLPEAVRGGHDLVLAGRRDADAAGFERRARDLGLADRVRFIGLVADADLPALYRGAALFVLPSLSEGFGLPVLEAMACGTPVVTSARTALPEVAGDAALLVDPRSVDAIAAGLLRGLVDQDLRATLRAAGPRRAAGFSARASAAAIAAILRDAGCGS